MTTLRSGGRAAISGLLLFAMLIAPAHAQQEKDRGAKPTPDLADVRYGPQRRNVLDLWKAKSDKPTPLVVFIHGGGFRAGSKEQLSPALLEGLLAHDISVMTINYRLSPEVSFPAHYLDSARRSSSHARRHESGTSSPSESVPPAARPGLGPRSGSASTTTWPTRRTRPVLPQSTRSTCMAVRAAEQPDPRRSSRSGSAKPRRSTRPSRASSA